MRIFAFDYKLFLVVLILFFCTSYDCIAQEDTENSRTLTREEILRFSIEELLDLPLEQLMKLSDIVGVSVDELFQLVHQIHGVRSDSLRSHFLSPVPVEVINQRQIEISGHSQLGQVLQYQCPSFHSTPQTISDGTDNLDPISLRGLGTDQVLVLVNGKRRHSSSYLHVNGTFGRGTVGTDLNAIPTSAIQKIEIMRDGAAAQYGSDAIAGVINIILKENPVGIDISSQTGISTEGDGLLQKVSASAGVELGTNGFLNLTTEFIHRGSINRSGDYTGAVYGDERDNNLTDFFDNVPFEGKRVMSIGFAETDNAMLFYNAGTEITEDVLLYFNGGVSYRQSSAPGFYRFPKDDHRVVLSLFPYGFSPQLETNLVDYYSVTGVEGKYHGWNIDLSYNFGANIYDLTVKNGNNASMGANSPISAYAGGFSYVQNIFGLDFSRKVDFLSMPTNIAFGTEFRIENYELAAGEQASWINGNNDLPTVSGQPHQVGFQYYPGFKPENELTRYRANIAAYLDFESDVTSRFLLGTAVRFERYSDFGRNLSWKVAARYRFHDLFTLRSAINTGFRAPSLQQLYYNRVSTQFLDGEPVQVVNFNNESGAVRAFGIEALQPELSYNSSFGITSLINDNLTVTIDGYRIAIQDRIIQSGRFKAEDDHAYAAILDPLNVSQAQFFTNAIDTETLGLDIAAVLNTTVGYGNLIVSLAYNRTKTRIDGDIKTSQLLTGKEDVLFNREEISRIESAIPLGKFVNLINYKINLISFSLRNTYFGEAKYIHPDDGNEANWQLNELTGNVESRDQIFSQKVLTDIEANYQFNLNTKLSVGINNVFNIYPDKHTHSKNISSGMFVYSRRIQQFTQMGTFVYFKLMFSL